jgi:hypothetical protein
MWEEFLICVASEMYSHMTLGVGHVGIIMGTTSHFQYGEKPLEFVCGIHGFDDGLCGLVLELHTHKENII